MGRVCQPSVSKSARKRTILARLLAAVVAYAATPTQAAIYYWDGNDGTAGFGIASGTWAAPTVGTTTAGWSTDTTGSTAIDGNSVTTATADGVNFGNGATGLAAGTIAVADTVDSGDITFAAGSGAIVLSGGTINLAAASAITVNNSTNTINSVLTGAGTSLTKAGTGTLVLSGANSYTGSTIINAGTLTLSGGNNRLPTATSVNFVGSGTTLNLGSNNQTVASLTFPTSGVTSHTISGAGGALILNGAAAFLLGGTAGSSNQTLSLANLDSFTYNSSGTSFTVSGGVTGSSTDATGTLTLADVNTITASAFNIASIANSGSSHNRGTVHLGQTNTIYANSIGVGSGDKGVGLLDFRTGLDPAPTLKIRGTTGATNDNARASILVSTNNSGNTFSTGTIDLTNGGTVASVLDAKISTLTIGRNTRNGTNGKDSTGSFLMAGGTLDATTIIVGQQTSTANNSANTFGTFGLNGGTVLTTTLTLADKLTATGSGTISTTLNLSSGTLRANTIQRGGVGTTGGAATINFNWFDGTIGNISGANQTVDGKNAISGLTAGLTINLSNTGNVSGTHTWDVTSGQTATVQNTAILSGVGSLTKTGTGTLVLAGANTYAGTTTVSAGTLVVNGSTTSNTGVQAAGTLGGTGTITGNVSGTGTVAPGNSIGTLNITGDYNVTGTHLMEISKSIVPVLTADLLNITGNLTYDGNLQVSIPVPELATLSNGDTWNLFDVTLSFSGSFDNNAVFGTAGDGTFLPVLGSGLAWNFNYGTGELSVVAIPEPSTLVLGGLALLGFAGAGLRRRRLMNRVV